MDENITIGELHRRLDRLEEVIHMNFKAIDDRLSTTLVNREYYLVRQEALEGQVKENYLLLNHRIDELETRNRNITQRWWTMVIALVAGIGGDIFALILSVRGH